MTEQLLAGPRTAASDSPAPTEATPADRRRLGFAPPELRDAGLDELLRASHHQVPPASDYERFRRRRAVMRLTRWLAGYPGQTWQERWVESGLDNGGTAWPDKPEHHGRGLLFKGARTLIYLGVIQPDYPWLLDTSFAGLFADYRNIHDPTGFTELDTTLTTLRTKPQVARQALVSAARICMRNGKTRLRQVTAADLVELDLVVRASGRDVRPGHEALWRALHSMGVIDGPTSLKATHRDGQLPVERLVDRYKLRCTPIRDLLVEYITDRSTALDYSSTRNLAFWLGKLFWADLEQHHPGIDSLRLEPDVAAAWKQRVAARTTRTGRQVPRSNRHVVLATVRAFYLDITQWAHEDPARWAPWAVPCPVRKSDLAARAKHRAKVTAKMHARTRTLIDFLPQLVATARTRRDHATTLLAATTDQPLGITVAVDGVTYEVAATAKPRTQAKVRSAAGDVVAPAAEEQEAFWAWAAIEVLRLSGLRIEEVLELTHLSIRRYTQPDGKVVPLLQIAPSKMDSERVFPISPELAHVLARIIERVRDGHDTVPLCPRYDTHERIFGPPLPHLFQRPYGGGHQVFSPGSVRNWLERTLARTNIRDVDGQPVRFLPHDFRRMFSTGVVNAGLPIHIAAAVLGHRSIDTTRGYTAIYPEEVIRHYQTFIQHRRAQRPEAEYRQPTNQEWAEFEQHFTLRQVAYGNCDRPYASPCVHEHACIRCPMLRPEPSRLPMLTELETNLRERIDEAREHVWLGEVDQLQQTLAALRDKTAQAARLVAAGISDEPLPLN